MKEPEVRKGLGIKEKVAMEADVTGEGRGPSGTGSLIESVCPFLGSWPT